MRSLTISLIAAIGVFAGLSVPAAESQQAIVQTMRGSNEFHTFDPTTDSAAIYLGTQTGLSGYSQGLTWGPDGLVYLGGWPDGLYRLDPSDWTATSLGASATGVGTSPYHLVVDNEAVGGPGLFGVSGSRSLGLHAFRTDLTSDSSSLDSRMPGNGLFSRNGLFAHPETPGTFVSANNIPAGIFALDPRGVGATCVVNTLCVLPWSQRASNSLMHEDNAVYAWINKWLAPTFRGFIRYDVQTGSCTSVAIPVPLTTSTQETAVWPDPPERLGRLAYVAFDAKCYQVDLSVGAVVTVYASRLPAFPINANHDETSQLSSWIAAGAAPVRTFHLNFAKYPAATSYLLVPSRVAYPQTGIPFAGMELWFSPDVLTINALVGNFAGIYSVSGPLGPGGEQDVVAQPIGFAAPVAVTWIAVAMDAQNQPVDVSNAIRVMMY